MGGRAGAVLGAVLVIGAGMFFLARTSTPVDERCIAVVGDVRTEVDLEQGQWAALMAARAEARGMPARATSIAIATAFQESKMRNIDYGHLDSIGLFQQRPSQGWGSIEQIMDPTYSIDTFYAALDRIGDYTSLEITVAAQTVQRSAYPDAYAQHETRSRALASALRGETPAAFWCVVEQTSGAAEDVLAELETAFGTGGGSVDGATVQFPAPDPTSGWARATWSVANASRLGVTRVSFDGRQWSVDRAEDGWTEADATVDTVTVSVG